MLIPNISAACVLFPCAFLKVRRIIVRSISASGDPARKVTWSCEVVEAFANSSAEILKFLKAKPQEEQKLV